MFYKNNNNIIPTIKPKKLCSYIADLTRRITIYNFFYNTLIEKEKDTYNTIIEKSTIIFI